MAKKTPEQVKQELFKKADIVKRVLCTADGEKLLKFLEEEFDHEQIFTPGDPHHTAYRLGQRDVVVYLKQMKRYGNED